MAVDKLVIHSHFVDKAHFGTGRAFYAEDKTCKNEWMLELRYN